MNLNEWLTILAILLAPVIAILVGIYLENRKEKKQAKLWIFRTLMATRATPMSNEHIRALNMIDVTFYGIKNKSREVVEAWKAYLDNLATNLDDISQDGLRHWGEKNQELLIEMLQKMAISLGYHFDKTSIKNTSYFPKGYGEQETEQILIRKGFVNMLKGDFSIPIEVRFPKASEEGEKFQKLLKDYFSGNTPLKVFIVAKSDTDKE